MQKFYDSRSDINNKNSFVNQMNAELEHHLEKFLNSKNTEDEDDDDYIPLL
jgi:hypothetical protein